MAATVITYGSYIPATEHTVYTQHDNTTVAPWRCGSCAASQDSLGTSRYDLVGGSLQVGRVLSAAAQHHCFIVVQVLPDHVCDSIRAHHAWQGEEHFVFYRVFALQGKL